MNISREIMDELAKFLNKTIVGHTKFYYIKKKKFLKFKICLNLQPDIAYAIAYGLHRPYTLLGY